uniref:Uncharacterized protein n=1 Tax=viral metagenome TaxID=1070528 RepID=A0A6C0DW97_9ZZZZ
MANILLGEQNKELLWNILYSNKTFETIPQSKFNNIKIIFENAIIKVVNTNLEMLESTTNINTIKTLITQLNKVILQNIIADIANFNKLLLTSTNVKENHKMDTLESFEKQYKEKQESFNEFMAKKEPDEVNFETIKEDTLETSELDKLLENIQKERLKDIAIISNKKQDNLQEVDLNEFEKEIFTEFVEQDPIKKKKICTIGELLHDVQNNPEKKDTQSLLLSIDEKLTLLMGNQQKIMEKLGLL